MTKYMLIQPGQVGDSIRIPGEIFEIKKLKHSIRFKNKDEKFKYIVVGEDELLSKKSLKAKFTKGTYKSETPKRIIKTLTIIFLYELSKYIAEKVIIRLQANDDVDECPKDYEVNGEINALQKVTNELLSQQLKHMQSKDIKVSEQLAKRERMNLYNSGGN
jgi:hypothetical protein